MKILAVSDEECPALWEHYVPGRLKEYDLIISYGDLKSEYLQFLVTMARCPLVYVHGNHDGHYSQNPPEGCDCIDGQLVVYNGVRILGLGGCFRYNPGEHQYTEGQMRRRIMKLRFALWRAGGVDIVVTHAPPRGLGDRPDPAHIGFQAVRDLVDQYHPQVLLHGHVHMRYGSDIPRELRYSGTQIINATERYVLDVPEGAYEPGDRRRILWKTRHK